MWRKLKRWWYGSDSIDKLTQLQLGCQDKDIIKILEQWRSQCHDDLDDALDEFIKDPSWRQALATERDRQELKELLRPVVKRIRMLILLPLQSNLEKQRPKR